MRGDADLAGPPDARLERALDALSRRRIEHLRETLAAHGLSAGDDMLTGDGRCAHVLLPLFDLAAADPEEPLATHLLLEVDRDGVLDEVTVVAVGRSVRIA